MSEVLEFRDLKDQLDHIYFTGDDEEREDEQDMELYRMATYYSLESDNYDVIVEVPNKAPRYLRKRVPASTRKFIWESTNDQCYLCRALLPRMSPWHIEHVVAYSADPSRTNVVGNMLPACASCNLRKNNKSLADCIRLDLTYDLATSSLHISHLDEDARGAILTALEIKHSRQQRLLAAEDHITITQSLENAVGSKTQLPSSGISKGIKFTDVSQLSEIREVKLEKDDISGYDFPRTSHFDLAGLEI